MVDPFEEAFWNLIQVLAWVFTGDRTLVRQASKRTTDHGSFFQDVTTPDGGKELIETRDSPPDFMTTTATAAWNDYTAYPSWEEAKQAVIDALASRRISAIGRKSGKGDLIDIPTSYWVDARFYEEPLHVAPIDYFKAGASHWYDLWFRRDEILREWPDVLASISSDANPSRVGYTSRWLPLVHSLRYVAGIVGTEDAWPQVRQAIMDGELSAQGMLDGVLGELRGEWLSAPMWEVPAGDTVHFRADRAERFAQKAPGRAERIEVDREQLRRLWRPKPHSGTDSIGSADSVPPLKKTRGPQPVQRNRVIRLMTKDIKSGKRSLHELQAWTQEALASEYKTKRFTAVAALKELLKSAGNSNSDK